MKGQTHPPHPRGSAFPNHCGVGVGRHQEPTALLRAVQDGVPPPRSPRLSGFYLLVRNQVMTARGGCLLAGLLCHQTQMIRDTRLGSDYVPDL